MLLQPSASVYLTKLLYNHQDFLQKPEVGDDGIVPVLDIYTIVQNERLDSYSFSVDDVSSKIIFTFTVEGQYSINHLIDLMISS